MKINRLLEITIILLNKGTITARELAERFGVSTRTIYRDVDVLSSAGVPFCQSCSMPMDVPELFGSNADGSRNEDYCTYCFKNGSFSRDGVLRPVKRCVS